MLRKSDFNWTGKIAVRTEMQNGQKEIEKSRLYHSAVKLMGKRFIYGQPDQPIPSDFTQTLTKLG